MSDYAIQSEVDLPAARNGRSRYPFAQMAPGDSFEAPEAENKSVRSAAHSYGKRHGQAFTCRRQPDGSVRVWRTE